MHFSFIYFCMRRTCVETRCVKCSLSCISTLAEKLCGYKEDLLLTTRLIKTIKRDVWGQIWNAEKEEEEEEEEKLRVERRVWAKKRPVCSWAPRAINSHSTCNVETCKCGNTLETLGVVLQALRNGIQQNKNLVTLMWRVMTSEVPLSPPMFDGEGAGWPDHRGQINANDLSIAPVHTLQINANGLSIAPVHTLQINANDLSIAPVHTLQINANDLSIAPVHTLQINANDLSIAPVHTLQINANDLSIAPVHTLQINANDLSIAPVHTLQIRPKKHQPLHIHLHTPHRRMDWRSVNSLQAST